MKFKKLISTAMAGVMALSLSLPAFADDVKVEGSINLPTINMVLPTTASMIMNPYELNVKLNPKDPAETPVDDQIISPLMTVKNLSNIGVKVAVSVQGTKGRGTAAFAAATTQGSTKSTVKEAFVYAMFSIGDPDMAIDDITAPSTVPSADAAYLTILSETAKEVTKLAAADAASTTAGAVNVLTGTTGKTAAEGGVLGFRFFGDMTQAPVAADGSSDPWTDKDILSATVSFTFSPVAGSLPADPPTT